MKLFIAPFLFCISFGQMSFADEIQKTTDKAVVRALTPKQALQKLVDGNERYTKDHLLHADSSAERREAISSHQEPFAIILGCSDSRVPPEIIFDQGVGDLFIVRVAGNVAGPIEIDSMEYAVKHLHSSLIMVLGHENCGAIKAVLANQLTEIDQIAGLIKPAVTNCKNVDQCVRANVEHVVKKIKESALISPHVIAGEVDVVGAYYDLNTGKVELLN
ncbi:MAG: carbonic anhydrase [Chlamydiota bacterium]